MDLWPYFPGGSQDALRASVEMQQALQSYNKERLKKKRLPVKVGIGMQSGKSYHGNYRRCGSD